MKKYNTFDRHMVLLGIIIPFLVFFISMNTTYAYFTATASQKESTTTTAIIKITLNDFNASGYTSVTSEEETINYIYPGDTLTVNGTLVNSGSSQCYAIIEFTLNVIKDGSTIAEKHTKEYYTFKNNNDGSYTKTEITGTPNNYSANADIIVKDGERDFTLTYTFTGSEYGNEYKNATATYQVRAQAIQTENLAATETEAAKVATNILMDNVGYSSTKIYGNSVQDSSQTPSPNNPVEIQSVGNKTINLFNFEKIKGQVGGVVDYDNQSIFLSSAENLYIIGQSFAGVPTAFNKFNEVLNITEPGYYCLRVKVASEDTDITTRASWGMNVTGNGAVAPTVVTNTYKSGYLFVKYNITQACLDSLKNNAETFRLYMYAFRKTNTTDNVDAAVSEFMFVKGDYTFETMPEHEPYGKYKISVSINETTTNVYLDEPLRKVGDVMDYLDLETGVVKRNIKSVVLDENTGFSLYNYASCYGVHTAISVLDDSYNRIPGLCNIARASYVGTYYQSGAVWLLDSRIYIVGILTELGLADADDFESTWQTDFLAWIEENPIETIYATTNPYEERTERVSIPEGATITINTTIAPTTFDS